MPEVDIRGTVAPGFEHVRDVFRENFAVRKEIGAACAVYLRGEKVVDLWGGARDEVTGAPWEEDTMVLVFSTTKGMAATAMAVAHSRALFDYDEPVARYWPEFAQHDKGSISVRTLLSHQAGLCVIDEPLDVHTLDDLDRLARALAAQRPAWKPGDRHGYHGISLGFYEGELLRRVDPKKRTLGRFFHDEVAAPLGVEFYIGLPHGFPAGRIARIKGFPVLGAAVRLHTFPWRFALGLLNPRSLTARAFNNPRIANPADLDSPAFRSVEMPASNGVGTARSIARVYSALALGGSELGIDPATLQALKRPATAPRLGKRDVVLGADSSFSLGFLKPCDACRFGSSETAFGTPGAGGSFGFADPDIGLGFSYVMNRMGFYIADDPREKALRDATYRCVAEMR
jgi:CubicO group peptidase (beta-lactamase class C family)